VLSFACGLKAQITLMPRLYQARENWVALRLPHASVFVVLKMLFLSE
jgi:hypothetical protein